jgi:formylglycine-generating enzyme required for sulfatase activity
MIKKLAIFGLLFCSFVSLLKANNLSISNLSLTGQNTGSDYVMVQFDISWENSWRTDNLNGDGVTNWDAAWIFIKYKKSSDGLWYHATLNTTVANHNTGSQGSSATITQTDGLGVFFHRSGNGTGTFSSTTVQLRWEYGTDGLGDALNTAVSEIKVFGIEMVYVAQGAFYLGTGGGENFAFYKYPTETNAYQVTSEAGITIVDEDDYLWANGDVERSSTIPAYFPKGYNSFYCMKYEITQEQYVEFLNILTRTQQNTRTATDISGTNIEYRYVISNSSTKYSRNGIRCNATIPASPASVTFYCDFNGNGTGNESDDGQNIACNYINWADGVAYADWAGLRPMTELEFEKACRGTANPVANEFAWGNTTITMASAVSNAGAANESVSSGNCKYNWNSDEGPLRVGIFPSGTRQSIGATYYGIMEMSGNLRERLVSIYNSTGRSFSGLNGNGGLNSSGDADVANWPGTSSYGSGSRGGDWEDVSGSCRISNRATAGLPNSEREPHFGFRCVRSVEP